MATRAGTLVESDPKSRLRAEEAADTITLRNFGGMNLQDGREGIGDDEFAWLEELIPIGNARLNLMPGPLQIFLLAVETGVPDVVYANNVGGVDQHLAIWASTGNAYMGVVGSGVFTKIASGVFTSGLTAVEQWSNIGLLLVDPVAGYYDYGITAPGTLTKLSGQVYGIAVSTVNLGQLSGGTVPSLRVNDASGTGATIGASASSVSVVIAGGGAGYSIGDRLTATGGTLTTSSAAPASQQNQPLILTVTNVAAGAITAVSTTNVGYYQAAPANPVGVTGGTGAGATFTVSWQVGNPYIITPGHDYVAPVVQAFIGGIWVAYSMTIQTSGTILGTGIAAYANRVWISIGRTVQFTDVNSYSSFGGSGGSFTISDEYLHNNITALFPANNYLYIFGDHSVNILSNVQVVNGAATFSNINASASIGTNQLNSIFPFQRTIAFANTSGAYIMSGATPEKISDKIDDLWSAIDFSRTIYGAQVQISNILCAAFLIHFADSFTQSETFNRSALIINFRGKWFVSGQFYSTSTIQLGAMISLPVGGVSSLYGWASVGSAPTFNKLLASSTQNDWRLVTKLWDQNKPLLDKQAINAGIGSVLRGALDPSFSVYVDNGATSVLSILGQAPTLIQWINNLGNVVTWINNVSATVSWVVGASGYALRMGSANTGGTKYLGLTATGNNNTSQIRLLALEMQNRRRW